MKRKKWFHIPAVVVVTAAIVAAVVAAMMVAVVVGRMANRLVEVEHYYHLMSLSPQSDYKVHRLDCLHRMGPLDRLDVAPLESEIAIESLVAPFGLIHAFA